MKTTVLRAKAQAVATEATRARQIEPEGVSAFRPASGACQVRSDDLAQMSVGHTTAGRKK